MHIHNKSIFDTLNEQLDKHRLFGSMGRPFKWKKAAKFNHNRTVKQKNVHIILILVNNYALLPEIYRTQHFHVRIHGG